MKEAGAGQLRRDGGPSSRTGRRRSLARATSPGVQAANWNGPAQTVIAGPAAAVQPALDLAASRGIAGRLLPVSSAFHTPMVASAREPFEVFAGASARSFARPARLLESRRGPPPRSSRRDRRSPGRPSRQPRAVRRNDRGNVPGRRAGFRRSRPGFRPHSARRFRARLIARTWPSRLSRRARRAHRFAQYRGSPGRRRHSTCVSNGSLATASAAASTCRIFPRAKTQSPPPHRPGSSTAAAPARSTSPKSAAWARARFLTRRRRTSPEPGAGTTSSQPARRRPRTRARVMARPP